MVTLSLCTAKGTKVMETRQQGKIGGNKIAVGGRGLGSGVYLYELRIEKNRLGKGLIVL